LHVRAHPTPVILVNKNWAWIKPTWEPVWPHIRLYIFIVNDGALVNRKGFNGTHCNVKTKSLYTISSLIITMETTMPGQHYETNEALQTAVRQCLRAAGKEFYRKGILKLPERWDRCVQRNGDCVEK
jgi:hypothetical protein